RTGRLDLTVGARHHVRVGHVALADLVPQGRRAERARHRLAALLARDRHVHAVGHRADGRGRRARTGADRERRTRGLDAADDGAAARLARVLARVVLRAVVVRLLAVEHRADRGAVAAQLVVQVRARRAAGVADGAD